MNINLILGDITKVNVDAIVNAANTSLLGGSGVDGAIHRYAGHELLDECRKLGGCKVGEAKLTYGYKLPAQFIIHTVGPVWNYGIKNEEGLLKSCYDNCFKVAMKYQIKTIAFPCISTGRYNFPIERAAKIAYTAAKNAIKIGNIVEVYFVCYDKDNYNEYRKLINVRAINEI